MDIRSTPSWEESLARKVLFYVIIGFIILAIVFGIYDLQISILVVDKQSIWGIFISDYGEIPGMIVILSSIFILDRNRTPLNEKKNIIVSLIILILLTLFIFYWFNTILVNKIGFLATYRYYFIPLIGILIFSLQQFLKKIDSKYFDQIDKIARITIFLAIINTIFFVPIVKILWGRIRFRDLAPNYSNYTPWFLPQGITEAKSFPSGHTAMGWMLLPLLLLALDKQPKTKIMVLAVVLVWGIIVAAGRIIIGAHYASDVLFSSCVAFVSFLFLYKHYYLQRETSLIH